MADPEKRSRVQDVELIIPYIVPKIIGRARSRRSGKQGAVYSVSSLRLKYTYMSVHNLRNNLDDQDDIDAIVAFVLNNLGDAPPPCADPHRYGHF